MTYRTRLHITPYFKLRFCCLLNFMHSFQCHVLQYFFSVDTLEFVIDTIRTTFNEPDYPFADIFVISTLQRTHEDYDENVACKFSAVNDLLFKLVASEIRIEL